MFDSTPFQKRFEFLNDYKATNIALLAISRLARFLVRHTERQPRPICGPGPTCEWLDDVDQNVGAKPAD